MWVSDHLKVDQFPSPPFLSAHARYAQRAAEACGYTFRSLDGADGYLFEVRDGARAATFAAAVLLAPAPWRLAAGASALAFAAAALVAVLRKRERFVRPARAEEQLPVLVTQEEGARA